jgi:hypothetical protein
MYIYDGNLNIRNFRREGMLSDEPEIPEVRNLWDYIVDDPWETSAKVLLCTGLTEKSFDECFVDECKSICNKNNDAECLDLVEKAETAIEYGKKAIELAKKNNGSGGTTETDTEKAKAEMRDKLNGLIAKFKEVPCSELTDAQKIELTNDLNKFESQFISAGLKAEFDSAISKLTCDVKAEFRCNDNDKDVVKFEPNPVCKPSFMEEWGKPLAIGTASGTAVGVCWYNFIKGSVGQSAIAGGITCGVVTYFLKKKNENETEVANG